MALIKIKGRGSLTNFYSTGPYTSFAFCSSPKHGRKQCMNFTTCKAFLHDTVRKFLHKGQPGTSSYSGYDYEKDSEIDMNKLRLLFTRCFGGPHDTIGIDQFKKNIQSTKRIINFYEETAGWRKSRILKVDHSTHTHVWLVTGPEQWMQAPQLISMLSLLIRACTTNGQVTFETNEDLEKIYKKWVIERRKDYYDLERCQDKMFLVMKHYEELFGGFALNKLYPDGSKFVGFHNNGIARLSQFASSTTELNAKFREICAREGVK